MDHKYLHELIVGFKGAGEMASAVAWRLYQANICRIFMLEVREPLAVRRMVSFCEAVYEGRKTVEGVEAVKATNEREVRNAWESRQIPVIVDPLWEFIKILGPDVVVDAILAKRNCGTNLKEAPLVIGLGPGFEAQRHAHFVIETNRGHNLGRVIVSGTATPNNGIPGNIGGYTAERVLRAPSSGLFKSQRRIGDSVKQGEAIGDVSGDRVSAKINGVVRGLIRSGIHVQAGLKLGDIDPRGDISYCPTISDKGLAIGGAVLEAILRIYNT